MEISKFIITQELDNSSGMVLVYSTLTTAIVTLDKKIYHRIFELADYSDTQLTEKLVSLGILTPSHALQLRQLDDQRAISMDSDKQHLTIFTTTDCNARCFYCFENGIKHIDMSKGVADATLQFIYNTFPNKELSIGWIGGEPLLRFDTIKYITEQLVCRGYTLTSGVSTNGILLTKEMIEFFKRNNKQMAFQFSMDAAVGNDYYKMKRYIDYDEENAFQHVVDNICMSMDYGITTDVRINYVASKIEDAKIAFRTIKEMVAGHDMSHTYIFLVPIDLPSSNEVISNYHGSIEHPCLQAIKFQKDMGFGVPRSQRVTPIRDELEKLHGDIIASYSLMPQCYICGMTTKHKFVIDSDGTLYKCHRLAGHKEYNCGTVFDGININSDNYRQFRKTTIQDNQCLTCSILPICQGGCIGRRTLCGESQKCNKIKQIQKELVRLCYDESMKYDKNGIVQISSI